MKHQVSELKGALLDAAVAKAEGLSLPHGAPRRSDWVDGGATVGGEVDKHGHTLVERFAPSSDWAHGGPIIERERISTFPAADDGWWAHYGLDEVAGHGGPTLLIAAMRAFVAGKFGEEVALP